MNWIQPFSLLQALIGICQVANLLGFPNKGPLNFRNSDFTRIDKAKNRFYTFCGRFIFFRHNLIPYPFYISSSPFMSLSRRRLRNYYPVKLNFPANIFEYSFSKYQGTYHFYFQHQPKEHQKIR